MSVIAELFTNMHYDQCFVFAELNLAHLEVANTFDIYTFARAGCASSQIGDSSNVGFRTIGVMFVLVDSRPRARRGPVAGPPRTVLSTHGT